MNQKTANPPCDIGTCDVGICDIRACNVGTSNVRTCAARTWNACGYVRLSREDGDKEESNSITGQKAFIRDFLGRHPELIECSMKVDDGFSGSSFERPAFLEMMEDVKAGKINCIVVKDLSRFGRNYLDAGEYIEKIFPFLGVRFIAINDGYDSLNRNVDMDALLIPFKNLINEAYCRDISMKIRSQLEIKRKKGDFIGSFAVYGYLKDPENKNHLIVDDFAADVVRDIFRWKLEGVSAGDIADRLNRDGILSPMDYKKFQGLRFATPFRIYDSSCWNATTVLRILKNPIYTGILVQGKNSTPNYKIRRRVKKPREEWDIVEGTHEAVIAPCDFNVVQKVLALDTRTSPGGQSVELFSGMVYCGECGAAMIRKTIPSGKKKYVYYVCAAHKNEKVCFSHSLRDSVLEEIVLESLRKQIQNAIDFSSLLEMTEAARRQKTGVKKLQNRLDKKQEEIERYQRLLHSLYESLTDGIIDREEYLSLKKNYAILQKAADEQVKRLHEEIEIEMDIDNEMDMNKYRDNDKETDINKDKDNDKGTGTDEEASKHSWIKQFIKNKNITELDRTLIVSLIERIFVYQDKQVEIVYSWKNEFQ